jgi:uncharacterized RDD family membrane protein YckC
MYDDNKPDYGKYPIVPIERRVGAFAIDFLSVWFVSAFFSYNLVVQWIVFITIWLILRVLITDKNKGQSLGRWAFDTKVIDPRFNRVPELINLFKREVMIGIGAALAIAGIQNFTSGLSMLLLLSPLAVDCSLALIDDETNLAGHDRLAQTFTVQTERGFSLDLRIKKIFGQIRRSMRR